MSNDMLAPVNVVRCDSITGTVAQTEYGETFAYLTLRTDTEVLNISVPSKREACHLSALMLDIADHLE
jgi:hypothetical protein